MVKVIYIKEAKTKGYVIVGVMQDGERIAYTVSAAVFSSCGSPMRCDELDADTVSAFAESSNAFCALKKALSLLSYADNSERNLKLKLLRAGYSRDIAEQTVREVVRLGYINEDNQLERLILGEANGRLIGPMKLIPKLVSKGYSVSDIRRVADRLKDAGELDFEANKKRLLDMKLSEDSDGEERYKLLHKYGYKAY